MDRPKSPASPFEERAVAFLRNYGFVLLLMSFYVLFQLLSINYGYHRDELYYLMMSRHLDFGYLELPALAPLLLFFVRSLLGSSLPAIHLLPALGGAAIILLTFKMARELGGGALAAGLAAVAAAIAPQYIGSDSLFSYDFLDKLAWALALYALVLYFRRRADKYLYFFGLAAGLGLLSKMSIVFLGAAFVAALLLTRYRKLFATRALYQAGSLAIVFALPYLAWQFIHHWPTLEFYGHYASGKTYPLTAAGAFLNQILIMSPVSFPLWAAGLYFLWRKDKGTYRPLAIMYLLLLALVYVIQAKSYMIAPFYTVLYAGGAVLLLGRGNRRRAPQAAVGYGLLLFLTGLYLSPRARPVLPVEQFIRYAGGFSGIREERHELHELPQHFADRFGWPELAGKAREAYDTLGPEEKKKAVFLTANYGEASAINFFGRKYGLPEAVSGHNQYYLWGPGDHRGEVVIAFNMGTREELLRYFASVEEAGRTEVEYAMPYEYDQPLYVCRGLNRPLAEVWPDCKAFD
jgi:hypothetical protein